VLVGNALFNILAGAISLYPLLYALLGWGLVEGVADYAESITRARGDYSFKSDPLGISGVSRQPYVESEEECGHVPSSSGRGRSSPTVAGRSLYSSMAGHGTEWQMQRFV
jgi:hypothetical protein